MRTDLLRSNGLKQDWYSRFSNLPLTQRVFDFPRAIHHARKSITRAEA
jgi:hypothetical protein